jgi:hypothetical protein
MANTSYKTDVAVALNIPIVDDWDIYDEDPENHLVLVHTNPDADLATYGWIKGIVLDTTTWSVVCQSFPNSTTVSLSMTRDLAPVQTMQFEKNAPPKKAEVFRLVTLEGQRIELNSDRIQWVDGFDGTLVRVWKYRGKIYISSHKRIHTNKATWGGSPPFKQLYEELGGPTDALFGPTETDTSRLIHTFLMVHPALQIGSHVPLEHPFLLYVGEHVMKGEGELTSFPAVLETLRHPQHLSLTEVNNRLKYGYYPPEKSPLLAKDPRTSHGEFVMCFEYTDATKTRILRCLKVQSDAYTWRVAMRDNDANLEHLVFTVAGIKRRDLRRRPDFYEFANRYPFIDLPTQEELPYLVPKIVPENDVGAKQRQIAIGCLVYATHPKRQAEVLRHFTSYLIALEKIRKWILRLDSATPERFATIENAGPTGKYVVGRVKNILQVSHGRADKLETPEEKRKELEGSIRYLVEHEYGESLYKIYRLYQRMDGTDAE